VLDIIYLTYRRNDDTESETGRRIEPIEITPEMIAAGVDAMRLFDSRDSLEMIAREVFLQMLSAGPRKQR
jgi:hypothetical protein